MSNKQKRTVEILNWIERARGIYNLEGGNSGVFAIAFVLKFGAEKFVMVHNDREPDMHYHVAVKKGSIIFDGSGKVTKKEIIHYGYDEDSNEKPYIEELPADDVFFDYIEKGTEPTIEVKDILDIE